MIELRFHDGHLTPQDLRFLMLASKIFSGQDNVLEKL